MINTVHLPKGRMVLLYVFDHMKRKKMKNQSMDKLLAPLREWSENNTKKINELKDKIISAVLHP